MKCAFILLSVLVASCYCSPVGGGKKISVAEDGSVTIQGQYGRWLVISNSTQNHVKIIEIAVGGPSGLYRKFHIDEQQRPKSADHQENTGKSGAVILSGIFQKYQGVVDERSYDELLQKIRGYVQSGYLSVSVYDILRGSNVSTIDSERSQGVEKDGGIQHGSSFYGLRQNGAWQQEEPSYFGRFDVPQFDESVFHRRSPFYGVQYPTYEDIFSGRREHINGYLPVSEELLGLYKPQQNYVYQQWLNQFDHQQHVQSDEQEGYNNYLQLINIQQSQLSPSQQRQLNILQQQFTHFQNQLSLVKLQQLAYLFKQWSNCGQVFSSEQYQCGKLHGEWIRFQQQLSYRQRQMLGNIHQQWVAVQEELTHGQYSQLKQLWSDLYQRWAALEMTPEQGNQLSIILPRLLNYKCRASDQYQQQYDDLRNEFVVFYQQLNVEQKQHFSNLYQIFVFGSRQQINPGEWIQLKQELNSYISHLVSGQHGVNDAAHSQYFLRIYQIWYTNVDSLVDFEQVLYNLYQRWVLFEEQLNFAQQQVFRVVYPKLVRLNLQRENGIWSQLHEEQYDIVHYQWTEFQQQLSIVQQQLLKKLLEASQKISLRNIDCENWHCLVNHLDVFVRQLVFSSQQRMTREDQLEFYRTYQFWAETICRRLNAEQFSGSEYPRHLEPSMFDQKQTLTYPYGRQNFYNSWRNNLSQKTHQYQIVPQQFHYGVDY